MDEYTSEWKEDAETFRKAAVKLGFIPDLDLCEDADPAEYEEQQYEDWKSAILTEILNHN